MRLQRRLDPRQGCLVGFGVTPIERADPHGKGDIEKSFASIQSEVFDCRTPEIKAAPSHLVSRSRSRQSDCLLRAVDGENEAVADAASDIASCNARTASDLQDAQSRLQWKRFDKDAYPI
ncbi:hypothetical protein LCM4577_11010 [Mesorhizobium sp. LCM 4577]|nr:hypothetical protein LCM4577_11010 [Mesorhizobium sp. LCM 4577]OHV75060.1 hypothetical protein LCM4576_12105 [Mesorhizobium sp. LCM 4576]